MNYMWYKPYLNKAATKKKRKFEHQSAVPLCLGRGLSCQRLFLVFVLQSCTVLVLSHSVTPTFCDPLGCSPPHYLSMGFSSQEYWSGLPCPPPGDLPKPGIKSRSPTLQADSLPSEPPGVTVLHSAFLACPFMKKGKTAPSSFPSATARLQFILFSALPGSWWCFWP